jgi:septum site-determining protein MinC
MRAAITVKGMREGVLITLHAGEWADLLAELAELVDSRKSFFGGGKVALEIGSRELSADAVLRLCRVFEERNVAVWAVLGTDADTRATIQELGLVTQIAPEPSPQASSPGPLAPPLAEPDVAGPYSVGILLDHTLRSGQSVCCEGHVVVLGDVNSGAEVIAGGDVVVWGRLRGIVHAGALGDAGRCVCAIDLSPTQLRIGSHIARPPEGRRRSKQARPERAFVSGEQIIAERWR